MYVLYLTIHMLHSNISWVMYVLYLTIHTLHSNISWVMHVLYLTIHILHSNISWVMYVLYLTIHTRVFFKNGVVQHMSGEDRYMQVTVECPRTGGLGGGGKPPKGLGFYWIVCA